jgi:hypothetical protein
MQYEFDVERAIYLTVLHRLFARGSGRAAERWREDYLIPGTEGLELHHLYRAMAFLGNAIEQLPKPTGALRCNKDLIEEALCERSKAKEPAPLKVKEVWVEDRRYVVCLNEEERRKDAHDREAIVAHLKEQLLERSTKA